ncbi:MAG: hypothetical protein II440_00905 [Clostridia bacterium]|nr:hypothetical protein [Clostridia bacterium]
MQVFFKTDIGNYRHSNQDDCKVGAFTDDEVWAVVCDGMGGHNGGNIASSMATTEIEKVIRPIHYLKIATYYDTKH